MMDDNYTALSIPSDHSLVDTVHNRKPQVKTCHSCSTQDNGGYCYSRSLTALSVR